jgi:3'(2'), 5'-bisphosphate nucleotidase
MSPLDPATLRPLLDDVARLCERAGQAILDVYEDPDGFGTEAKADGSPLTRADLASHRILVEGLTSLTPDVPVLSEESAEVPYEVRATWTRFWLVDPLDGTKEFVKRNGEFTVNVALIEVRSGVGVPVAGVVHVPVAGATYLGGEGVGAWRDEDGARTQVATTAPGDGPVRVVASRSHGNPATDAFIDGLEALFGPVERTSSGSSLKLCRVADGSAHYYPRVAPTMEWDTAAAHAIVTAAGGVVWRYGTTEPLRYAKKDLLNPHFLVAYAGDAPLPDAYRTIPDATPEEGA